MKQLLPDLVSGYEIAPISGLFSIVEPEESINLIHNPTPQYWDTGYGGVSSATVTRSIEQQRRSEFSMKVESGSASGSGIDYDVTLDNDTRYTFSVDVYGLPGIDYALEVYYGATLIARKIFRSNRRWRRPYLVFGTTSAGSHSFRVTQSTAKAHTYYTDGWQVEEKSHPTTFFHGDMEGYVVGDSPYLWLGAKYASRSYRSETTNSGGREHFLREFNFRLTGYSGLGMSPVNTLTSELVQGGSFYNGSVKKERPFTLVGTIFGSSSFEIGKNRAGIINIVRPDRNKFAQPIQMRYYPRDDESDGDVYLIKCVYQSGLEGNITNPYQEQVAIQFLQTDPTIQFDQFFVQELDQFEFSTTYTAADQPGIIIRKDAQSELVECLYGANGDVTAMTWFPDGNLYFGGDFTTAESITLNHLGVWDGENISYLGSPGDGIGGIFNCVNKMIAVPNGEIWIAGGFEYGGTGAAQSSMANLMAYKPSTGTWRAIGTPSHYVYDMIYLDGTIFVCGVFTTIGGTTAWSVAKTSDFGNTWEAITADMLSICYCITGYMVNGEPRLYLGDTNHGIYYFDGTSYTEILTWHIGGIGTQALTWGKFIKIHDNEHYATGWVIDATYSYLYFYLWRITGTKVELVANVDYFGMDIPSLKNALAKYTNSVLVGINDGTVIIGSDGKTQNFPGGYFSYNHNQIFSPGIISSITGVSVFAIKNDTVENSEIAYGLWRDPEYENRTYSYSRNVIQNDTESEYWPRIRVLGPGYLYFLMSAVANKYARFSKLYLGEDEELICDFSPDGYKFTSNYRGDVSNKLYGSRSPNFSLDRGKNIFMFVSDGSKVLSGDMNGESVTILGANNDNTDDGVLYVTISGSSTDLQWDFYSDSGKTDLVGSANHVGTGAPAADDILPIQEENNSGLHGWIFLDGTYNTGNATIKALRGYISWKRHYGSLDEVVA